MQGIQQGKRWAVSKGLTLAESQNPEKQDMFERMMKSIKMKKNKGFRVGISGPPGAGKSSLIEVLGTMMMKTDPGDGTGASSYAGENVRATGHPAANEYHHNDEEDTHMHSNARDSTDTAIPPWTPGASPEESLHHTKRLAVLAVDPSSASSGGSILGDKTRMPRLSCTEGVFVRPSASGTSLGGVNRATYNSVLFCTAAGFDTIVIETVGVGQSETAVAHLVDCMVLVLPPVGGDELQMIKKGITEFADIVVVNKADGIMKGPAHQMAASVVGTLQLSQGRRKYIEPQVVVCSAHTGYGVEKLKNVLEEYRYAMAKDGILERERERKIASILWSAADAALLDVLHTRSDIEKKMHQYYLPQVVSGQKSLAQAAREIVQRLIGT